MGAGEQELGLDVAEGRANYARSRVEPRQLRLERVQVFLLGDVRLRDDERVGRRDLLKGLGTAETVHAVNSRHDRVERVVMR